MDDAATLPTSARLRQAIEEEIATGLRRPGDRLDEASLARHFAVSRTPIREALQQLATAGMVDMRPRRGAIVVHLGPQRLYEMFEVMAELEALAGRLAARRITDAEGGALAKLLDECRAAIGDPDGYYAANERFHQAIYTASGSAFLVEQCLALQKRLRPYRRLQLRVRNRLGQSFAEHERIVAAILSGDGAGAAEALRAHVRVQGERFADLAAELTRLEARPVEGAGLAF